MDDSIQEHVTQDYSQHYSKTALKENKEKIKFLIKGQPLEYYEITSLLSKVAKICTNQAKYKEALRQLNQSLEICRQTMSSNDRRLGVLLNNIGIAYDKFGSKEASKKALACHEESLKIDEMSHDKTTEASLNVNIGRVYASLGDYEKPEGSLKEKYYKKSLEYLNKALEIEKILLAANDPKLASTQCLIGGVYLKQGKYDKALKWYNDSLVIREQNLQKGHPHIAHSHLGIGKVYYERRDYKRALKKFNEALVIYSGTLDSNDPKIAYMKAKIEEAQKKDTICNSIINSMSSILHSIEACLFDKK